MAFWNIVLTSLVTLIVAAIPIVLLWQKNKAASARQRAEHKLALEKQPADNFNNMLAANKMLREELLADRKEIRAENQQMEEELYKLKMDNGEITAMMVTHTNKIAQISLHNKALFKHLKLVLGMKTIIDVNNSKIFVLEDDENDTVLLKRLFSAHCIRNVSFFKDTEKFYAAIDPDVRILIIDYKLDGGMTGIDVINKVKAVNDFRYFIMLSGMEDFEVVYKFNRAVTHGIFLLKGRPETSEVLVRSIKDTVHNLTLLSDTYSEIYLNN